MTQAFCTVSVDHFGGLRTGANASSPSLEL